MKINASGTGNCMPKSIYLERVFAYQNAYIVSSSDDSALITELIDYVAANPYKRLFGPNWLVRINRITYL